MPLSRQKLRVDQAGHEDAVRPRLRAAAFDRREPVTRRAAALEALFRADWQRSPLPGRAAIWRSLPKAIIAPGSWSSTSWRRPSWPLRSLSWLLGTPEATAVRQLTEVDQHPRLQLDGMPLMGLVHACWCASVHSSSESVIETFWPEHEAKATGWSSIQG